jgi:glucosyl-dolichyl phosphate glucuronosyltransferase
MATIPQISVIISTYNRADLLPLALQSLAQQTLSSQHFEVIVVDNNCTDDTPSVVRQAQTDYSHLQLHYITESRAGISFARNTGVNHSQAAYVAFLDDDAQAEKTWLENAVYLHKNLDPKPMCIGGDILVFTLETLPKWFKESYEEMRWQGGDHWLTSSEPDLWGSNIIWDKATFIQAGMFPTDRGMVGNIMSAGEETSMFRRLFHPSAFYYSSKLVVYHWLPAKKATIQYRLKRQFLIGQSVGRERIEQATLGKRLYLLGGSLKGMLVHTVQAILNIRKHPHWQQWVVEDIGRIVEKLGYILRFLGIRITFKRG